ncbi:MAG TPA: glycogen synthase GlgA [Candidatus Binatia bacterium]|nr:glycogen synthase GlgA [Candidatus Binatia bacterium]
MKIAMIASEANPFAKTGGLADVLGTLSVALEHLGHEVTVILPAYRCALQGGFALQETGTTVTVPVADRHESGTILRSMIGKNVSALLIRADRYFDRDFLYGTATKDYPDNAERFTFFCRAALELLRQDPADIIHAHDWQAALAIVFLKTQAASYRETAGAKTVFTIHNLGFQGIFPQSEWKLFNLDKVFFTPQFLEFYDAINLMKGALVFADKLTTVSPTYAQEIMTPNQGFGLEGIIQQRAADLVGILNGVDYSDWNPWTDSFIKHHYGKNSLTIKDDCKKSLCEAVGLPHRPATPLLAMISRLTVQKGFDLVEAVFDNLMERDVQFILLGSGEPRFENFFNAAAARYGDRVAIRIGFDERLAHQIEAGADLFLMPSRYEPCGLNQMYSLKYGTPPIVRAVGGLKDSVQDYDPANNSGTGFVFTSDDADALLGAIDRGLLAYRDKANWTALRRRAMAMDFSWERSAQHYRDIYKSLLS